MPTIGIPKESNNKETRVSATPDSVRKLTSLKGVEVMIENGLGDRLKVPDQEYEKAGAAICPREKIHGSDFIFQISPMSSDRLVDYKKGSVYIGCLDPYNRRDLIQSCVAHSIDAVSMEMMPRSTRAQKMDVLSSQASIAGYAAVVVASEVSDKLFPMMMTPAGTISPARVFVIGAGVAGLQAIATAKRMGARVDAFDTRPVVKEQVESLGAKFLDIDLGETGQTKDGYAKALSQEQLSRQRDAMKTQCAQSDIVITTAQLFGRTAPVILNDEILSAMKPGSVIVDLAAESGGNVSGSRAGEIVEKENIFIVGAANFPGRYTKDASQMYASNLYAFFSEFYSTENQAFEYDPEDEILSACYLVREGKVIHPSFAEVN
jgi:H+-translocating NAD(P) transhydrogenase subunit alpha